MKIEDKVKPYILSKDGEELGVLWYDIQEYILTPNEYKKFEHWMRGQTSGLLTENVGYVYTGDLLRFLRGLPIID